MAIELFGFRVGKDEATAERKELEDEMINSYSIGLKKLFFIQLQRKADEQENTRNH